MKKYYLELPPKDSFKYACQTKEDLEKDCIVTKAEDTISKNYPKEDRGER